MAYVAETPAADAPASPETPYTLTVGLGFKGVFSSNADRDWVKVGLLAGKTYEISLAGADDNSQADTVLRVFNAQGEQVAVNDDLDFDAGRLDSRLTFSPETDGIYYLSAGAYSGNPAQDHSGSYLLSVVDPEDDRVPRVELQGGDADDVFQGGPDDDDLSGGGGNDTLHGMAGADFLVGNLGDDLLDGGAGSDLLLGDNAPPLFPGRAVLLNGGGASGGSGGGVIVGASTMAASGPEGAGSPDVVPLPPALTRDDVLAYLADQLAAGNDTLRGGPGNDWLEGGAGDDELLGGDDDDVLFGDSSLVFIPGLLATAFLAGDDLYAGDAVSSEGGDDPEAGIGMAALARGDDPGDAFNHVLMLLLINDLTPGDDRLEGGAGNDRLDGGGGNDELLGGPGMDLLEGGAGNDQLDGGEGVDYLHGGAGADRLLGGSDNDWLAGGPGNDVLEGGAGDDHLMGDVISSSLLPGMPEDGIVVIDDGNALIDTVQDDAGSGNDGSDEDIDDGSDAGTGEVDTVHDDADSGNDDAGTRVGADDGDGDAYVATVEDHTDDASIGGPGPSAPSLFPALVFGSDDELSGGPGADLIDGGGGNDRLSGGEGADVFVFAPWSGNDLVTDFVAAEDKLDLGAFADIHSVDDLSLRQQENDLVIDLSAQGGGEIRLQNFDAADLTDAQFIFFTGEDSAAAA